MPFAVGCPSGLCPRNVERLRPLRGRNDRCAKRRHRSRSPSRRLPVPGVAAGQDLHELGDDSQTSGLMRVEQDRLV